MGEISELLTTRFGIDDRAVAVEVTELGMRQFVGGESITQSFRRLYGTGQTPIGEGVDGVTGIEIDKPIPLSLIPEIPGLFGDEPEGKRVHVEVEIEFPDDRKFLIHHLDLPDSYSPAELYAAVRALLERLLVESPTKIPFDEDDIDEWGITDVISIGRRY